MFEKILAQLKTKYKDLGLSENILKVTAETLAKTVDKEEGIETAVAGVEGQMKTFQSLADQNRTLTSKVTELEKGKGEPEPTPAPIQTPGSNPELPKPTGGEEPPAWAKAIIESNKAILEKQNQLDAEKVNKTNAEKLVSKLKELGVNESFYSLHLGKTFEKDDEIDSFATTVKEAEDKYLQDTSNEKLKSKDVPLFGQTTKEGEVSPDVQALIDSKKS
ncbi:hypothetical protein I6H88_13880 [Elizabethkingia bruuniana]|uniref:Scaffolding protein n=1 Tax=Elizabethkingia bruuniana TaxID=1756149 RepID=A0A7T7UWI1_9FLAO|nr:hypothetical protein [Elizabethkingia bruuniana]KGO08533.1 hypothetical protein KS04_18235 [Elizabethkingia miricola]QDZ63235.1 hypothetical protein EVD20_12130 [Elizabethkingia bruuniana]QQN57533.1 hypothetical protein I6H88_13880 [Elizabethkingia bruuniana]